MRGRNLFRKTIMKTPSGRWRWTIQSGWDGTCLRVGKADNYVGAKAEAMQVEQELFRMCQKEGATSLTTASEIITRASKIILAR